MSRPGYPTVSSFDLLGGRSSQTQRRRLVFLTGIGLVAGLAVLLLARATVSFVMTNNVTDEMNRLNAQKTSLNAEITKATGGAKTEEEMVADLRATQTKVRSVLSTELDHQALLSAITAIRLPGATVVGVTVAPAPKPAAKQTTGTATRTPLPTSTKVTIVATVANLTDVTAWADAVRQALPALTRTDVTWRSVTGNNSAVNVTITGDLPLGATTRLTDTLKALEPEVPR